MEITITHEADVSVFALSKRLDAVSAPKLEEIIGQWLEQTGKNLIFNLEDLEYISSAGLRVLLNATKKIKARDGKLYIAGLRENVKEVFTISGFLSIIPAFNTLGDAQQAIR